MLPKLSKVIGELEQEDLKVIWQPPDIYEEVMSNSIWLVYGRKGSGKSTLVDYLGADKPTFDVLTFRPGDTDLFRHIAAIIRNFEGEDRRVIEEAVSCAIDFVMTIWIMRKNIDLTGSIMPKSNKEVMYNFLTNEGLIDGSPLLKAINFISKAAKAVKKGSDLDGLMQTLKGNISFEEVKRAFYKEIKEQGKKVILCIDDIDEIGFSFSKYDRHFVNGLIMFMVKNNKRFVKECVNIRIILTMPSELYFHSTLWGGDWVTGKSECLSWHNIEDLQAIVNKRIAHEMNVKKSKRRSKDDKYSISTMHTWGKVFPSQIANKLGVKENTFEYLIRHTFYTPRHVLGICDNILSHFKNFNKLEDVKDNLSDYQWCSLIQTCVEEYCSDRETDFRNLFGLIYHGLDDVLSLFSSRPFIWNRHQLISYIEENNAVLERTDTGEKYRDIALIEILQQIGFLGLGVQSVKTSPVGSTTYDLRFSFLENHAYRGGWDLAVIAPLFYDIYDVRPVDKIKILPHKVLTLRHNYENLLATYDPKTNQFSR